jgi:hypothetical protein
MATCKGRNMSWLKRTQNKYILSVVGNESFILQFDSMRNRMHEPIITNPGSLFPDAMSILALGQRILFYTMRGSWNHVLTARYRILHTEERYVRFFWNVAELIAFCVASHPWKWRPSFKLYRVRTLYSCLMHCRCLAPGVYVTEHMTEATKFDVKFKVSPSSGMLCRVSW